MTEFKDLNLLISKKNLWKRGGTLISNEEKVIIEGIRNKNESSLNDLIKLYGHLVRYVASNILKEEHLKEYAEEVYNDVFNTVWFNIDCFDYDYGNFKGWIISITKFKTLDLKKKRFKDSFNIEFVDEITTSENESSLENKNEDLISIILENLEEKDRIIFIKRYLEGYSIKEISKDMGYSENYIHTRISRSRKKVKNLKLGGAL